MISEPRAVLRRDTAAIWLVGLFSVFVNLLVLTGPIFMLQVYDRVLASRSVPTLVALFALVVVLYGAMGLLDFIRGRIGARVGARVQDALDTRTFRAALAAPPRMMAEADTSLFDLEAVRRFLAAPVAFALFDLPFTPLFLGAIFLFHPYLGWLAVAGGAVLIVIAVINQITSLAPGEQARRTAATSSRQAEQIRAQVETVRALGMTDVIIARWRDSRDRAVDAEIGLSDRNGGFAALTKSLRLLLQSAMLALGAWLVIQEQLTAGAMVASSIMLGRALAPIEQIVGGWAVVSRARKGWAALQRLLAAVPPPRSHMPLAQPKARLTVNDITVIPPGGRQPVLRNVSFSLYPGQVLGVVGESASGKSSVARALTGIWPLAAGEIRLDGATLEQYGEEALARHIGYLPQDVALFDATIAENIARLSPSPRPEDVIRAATEANAHEMILSLQEGYDTPIGHAGAKLSGGQKQRVGLARAIYGNPVVVILDEPNSNLDAPGTEAVNLAIRHLKQAGKAVVVMAHRPAALAECDLVLIMRDGRAAAFGPRDELLRSTSLKEPQPQAFFIRRGREE